MHFMVVVTGADGQLGQALVRALVKSNHKVRIVLKDLHTPGFDGLPVEKISANLLEPLSLIAAFEEAEIVFHCDIYVDLMPYKYPKLYKYNVRGVEHIIHACRINRVKRLICLSSILAFGFDKKNRNLSENLGMRPFRSLNSYAKSMAFAGQKIQAANGTTLETIIIAPSAIIGPYDYSFSLLGRLIWDFSRGRLPAYSRGGMDVVDCRDLAEVCLKAAFRGKPGSIYLVSGGHISIERLMRNLQQITGQRRPWVHLPTWMMYGLAFVYEIKHRIYGGHPLYTWAGADLVKANQRVQTHKVKEELDFNPRPIKQSLVDAWNWYRDHHHAV